MFAQSTRFLTLVIALTLLCACGQKGDLYLPEARFTELDAGPETG